MLYLATTEPSGMFIFQLAIILIELGRKYLSPRTCAASQKSSIQVHSDCGLFLAESSVDLPSLEGRRRRAWVAGRLWFALGGGVRVIVVDELDAAVFVGAVVDAELRGQGLDALGALAHLPRAVVDRACGLASLTVAFVAGRIRVLAAVGLGGSLGSVVDLAHGHGLPDSESRGLVPRNRSGRPNRLGGRRVGTIVTVDRAGHVRAIDGGDTQIRGCEVTQRRVARDRRQVRGRPAQRRRRRSSGGRCVPRDPALGRGV